MQRPSNQNKHRSFLNSWKSSSTSTARRPAHPPSTATTTAVGAPAPAVCSTEVIASQALKKNAQAFQYPSSGFAIKIEYSLLYTMMNHPEIYPATVIQSMIKSEDFTQYMEVNPSASPSKHHDATLTIQDDTQFSSYAQLSALLALAAEKWPPPSSSSSSSDATASSNTENDIRANPSATNYSNDAINVVQVLCQLLIQCVIRHAEAYSLDRETEINELFLPFQRVTSDKANRTAVMAVLPAYVGMTASILTGGNPLPFYIGYAVSINAIANQERDLANFKQIANTTSRMSNVETTNLLNDTDYDE
jgi:hypothetical protein